MSNDAPSDRPWDRAPREPRPKGPRPAAQSGANGLASAALVLGILALLFGPLLGVPAFIIGLVALSRPHGRTAATIGLVLGGVCSVLVPVVLVYAVGKVRAAAARLSDQNNLKQIGLGFHSLHDVTNGIAPYAMNQFGQPNRGLSWRVELLPYLEQDNLYRAFDTGSSWDSRTNARVSARPVRVYHTALNLNQEATGDTPYRVFIGGGALFNEDGKRVAFGEVKDTLANTLMVVHATEQVPWAAPRDFAYSPDAPLPAVGHAAHPNWFNACLTDGSVRLIPAPMADAALRALVTRAGGEPVEGW
jgi:hypothetical protein